MIQTVGKEEGQSLDSEDLENFPCEELRTINQLWLSNSDQKFGFSVQKEIYESLKDGGVEDDYNVFQRFGDRVGWRKDENWVSYSDLFDMSENKENTLKRGHLPIIRRQPAATGNRMAGVDKNNEEEVGGEVWEIRLKGSVGEPKEIEWFVEFCQRKKLLENYELSIVEDEYKKWVYEMKGIVRTKEGRRRLEGMINLLQRENKRIVSEITVEITASEREGDYWEQKSRQRVLSSLARRLVTCKI